MFNVQIVDDEPIVRMGLKKLIPWEKYGFKVVCEAQNGIEALKQLENNKIDLTVTDIEMPIMNGIEFIKKVNEKKYKPHIVILTAYEEFEYAKTAIDYGVMGYIIKPIIESQICEMLEQIREKLTITVNRDFDSELDRKLIEAVIKNDDAAFQIMEEIIEEEKKYGEKDISGTCYRFFYILESIIDKVNKKFSNLNKIEKLNVYFNLKKERYITKEDILLEFKDEITRIFKLLQKNYLIYDNNIIRLACNYVIEHIDEKIGLAEVSDALGISKNYLCSLFKQETGENFLNYVTRMKMERAKYLLKEKDMKIYEVSNFLGYSDTAYFAKLFRKYCNMTPYEYKKSECEYYEMVE